MGFILLRGVVGKIGRAKQTEKKAGGAVKVQLNQLIELTRRIQRKIQKSKRRMKVRNNRYYVQSNTVKIRNIVS